jgi:hypothetical protein
VRLAAHYSASDALVPLCLRPPLCGLLQIEGEASPKRKFKAYPIGYFHIDIAEVRTLYHIVAIDRTSDKLLLIGTEHGHFRIGQVPQLRRFRPEIIHWLTAKELSNEFGNRTICRDEH